MPNLLFCSSIASYCTTKFGRYTYSGRYFAVVESGRLVSEDGWDLDILTPYEKEVGLDLDGNVLLDNHRNVLERIFYLADTNAITAPAALFPT